MADLPADLKAVVERERVGRNKRTERQEARAEAREDHFVATRELSLLKRDPSAKPLALPAAKTDDPRPFEVIGIPLPTPGYHVVEIESQRLGAALLGKPAPMYVRTGALVTNLGVHAKFGRVNAGVWVTSLDRAKPVAGAAVQISDCRGQPLWNGVTDARGFAFVPRAFPGPGYTLCSEDGDGENGYFVSARKPIAEGPNAGRTDLAFVWSNWNEGIESWRFALPSSGRYSDEATGADDRTVAHTVFDRTLLRAGQTVSMKHYLRTENLVSLSLPDGKALPTGVEVTHVGSDQKYTFDLAWRGNRYAETTFKLPDDAKLGLYNVALKRGDRSIETGSFRVEEFRLPVMRGRIEVLADGGKGTAGFVRPTALSAGVAIAYTNGGSASAVPVRVSAALRPRSVQFAGYDGYAFQRSEGSDEDEVPYADFVEDGPRVERAPGQRIVADKLGVTLDKDGAGKVALKDLPAIDAPRELLVEATYPDPNGEIQTLSQTVSLWPAAYVVGVRADDWVSVRGKTQVKLVALDTAGKPVAGAAMELRGIARNVRSIRKRMVGGFYAYDNQRESKELGVLCSGKSNAQGLLFCTVALTEPGNVDLVAGVKDAAGNGAQASTSVWVTREAELWFGGENQDRVDVLPEKKSYAPGDIAKFQVRMPFRTATALVAIERDGIVATQVVDLHGDDPTVSIKVEPEWAPNVFVSVLAVRGRIRDVPWYSFFTWGWKSPTDWWRAWREEGKLYEPPTALVDLGKPAFKYGIAAIQVDQAAHRLKVAVTTDQPDYAVRATAKATVRVTTADGKPVAGRHRGRPRGGRRGTARADAERELESLRRDDPAARVRHGDRDRADADRRQAPLRPEGRAARRRRRGEPEPRAVRHAAGLEGVGAARRERQRDGGCAAQRFADGLPHRRGGRRGRRARRVALRHRQRDDPLAPGPADRVGAAAAGARGRPLSGRHHAAQHDEGRDGRRRRRDADAGAQRAVRRWCEGRRGRRGRRRRARRARRTRRRRRRRRRRPPRRPTSRRFPPIPVAKATNPARARRVAGSSSGR